MEYAWNPDRGATVPAVLLDQTCRIGRPKKQEEVIVMRKTGLIVALDNMPDVPINTVLGKGKTWVAMFGQPPYSEGKDFSALWSG